MGLSTSPYENNFRWIVLGLATWAQATATFVTYGVGPLAAIWQQIYSLSQTQVGLLISVVNIGPLLSMLMIGHALDRYGERWIVGIGSLLLGLTMGFTSLTSSYGAFLFVLFLSGFIMERHNLEVAKLWSNGLILHKGALPWVFAKQVFPLEVRWLDGSFHSSVLDMIGQLQSYAKPPYPY